MYRAKRALGLSANNLSKVDDETLDRVREMLEDGCSHMEIALTLGIAATTIKKYFPGTAWTHEQVGEHNSALKKYQHATKQNHIGV